MMINNEFKKSIADKKILIGNGKKYSSIGSEAIELFYSWLKFCCSSEKELDKLMKEKPYEISEKLNQYGELEVYINAGGKKVLKPFVFQNTICSYENFLVDCLLILNVMVGRYGKDFEIAVKKYANKCKCVLD